MSATKRRAGPSIFWRLLGWLMRERRGGFDRRARADEPVPLAGGRARKELIDADDR